MTTCTMPGHAPLSTRIDGCRSCGCSALRPVLDLGMMPLADRLIVPSRAGEGEPRFPLEVVFCPACSLVQIDRTVDPTLLFATEYPYYSSFSDALLAHSRANALELIETRRLGASSLVVELASNDGYLLKNFVERGVPVLGIDPASGPAEAARRIGVDTLCEFFTEGLARRLAGEGRCADLVIGNNVLAHVADTNGFVRGIATLLRPGGAAVLEFPYVRDLIDHNEFDTIYHEHLCYFSLHAARALFARHGLHINRVRRLPIHGGSLRISAETADAPDASVLGLLAGEREAGLDAFEYYAGFARRTDRTIEALRTLVLAEKAAGKTIAAYGAAAKGATMLNAAGLDHRVIDFVVDRNIHKHGTLMPGVRIPVSPVERLTEEQPDLCVLLAWNFKDEILRQQSVYRDRGGRFIVPIPSACII